MAKKKCQKVHKIVLQKSIENYFPEISTKSATNNDTNFLLKVPKIMPKKN